MNKIKNPWPVPASCMACGGKADGKENRQVSVSAHRQFKHVVRHELILCAGCWTGLEMQVRHFMGNHVSR